MVPMSKVGQISSASIRHRYRLTGLHPRHVRMYTPVCANVNVRVRTRCTTLRVRASSSTSTRLRERQQAHTQVAHAAIALL